MQLHCCPHHSKSARSNTAKTGRNRAGAALDQDVEVVLITLLDCATVGGGLGGGVADPALQGIAVLITAMLAGSLFQPVLRAAV